MPEAYRVGVSAIRGVGVSRDGGVLRGGVVFPSTRLRRRRDFDFDDFLEAMAIDDRVDEILLN